MLIKGLVLAGGAGSRMGSIDKGLYVLNEKPLVDWVIESLSNQCDELIISCNRNVEQYQQRGYLTIQDDGFDSTDVDYQGPLAGITQAINHLQSSHSQFDYLMICPCDTPYIPTDMVAKLHQQITAKNTDVAVVHDGERRHNLHCLIKVEQLPNLAKFYTNGGRAIREWFDNIKQINVDFSDRQQAFININTQTISL